MKKFRIKEVKNERVSSCGSKASNYYPQVTNWLGFFRNIKPSEMKGDEYKGKVIRFRDISNAYSFISKYKSEKMITTVEMVKRTEEKSVIFHKA